MSARPENLPDFANPPVVETVLSVQFDPLTAIRTAHLGLLWDKFRATFPRSEERPPLDPVFEQFPEPPRARLGLQLQPYENLPVSRLWFLNETGSELIQVQSDRFIKNWRKEGEGEQYPRYEHLKASFERDFAAFQNFLRENELGGARINQCEVTYVNHILAGDGWDSFADIDKIFTFWSNPADQTPGIAQDMHLHARYVIPGTEGAPIGRLHVDVQPAYQTADARPMYVFHLTARGQVGRDFEFFDIGRAWIVNAFASLTTSHMHKTWRRRDTN